MSKVTIDTSITINVEQADGITAVMTLTIEEARALKDELIRAVGAQNPITHPPGVRDGEFAPVLRPKGGFLRDEPMVSVHGVQVKIPGASMTDEERKISVVTNAIAYAVESYKPSRGVTDVGTIYMGDVKTEMYSAVAKYVLETLDTYERQQSERGTKV